jgi:type I site-specific restriction-modification system R (restriction) subunit
MTTQPAAIGHNNPPSDPVDEALDHIQDLYDEAKHWADGEPITSEEMHDAVTALYDGLHAAGKAADELRKEAKRPLDEQIDAIQKRFNPAIQPKRGLVDLGKAALGDLLAAWRTAVAKKKADEAAAARAEADRIALTAQQAMQASRGNLEEREKAEALLQEAKAHERHARRTDKAATTGTGLRSYWVATLTDAELGLDWAYGRSPERFTALVQMMADEAVRGGARAVPGFAVTEEKRAN